MERGEEEEAERERRHGDGRANAADGARAGRIEPRRMLRRLRLAEQAMGVRDDGRERPRCRSTSGVD